jgi:two-component system sensor histidine kinase PilS (NtrC family)
VLIFQDLTQVVQMEEQLRRSERLSAVGQLAAGLAHEIRNPLASLSGAIELLAGDLPDPDPSSRRLVRIVQRETARLNRLVGDFLSYAGPGPVRHEVVHVRELLEEIGQLIGNSDCAGVELCLEVPGELAVLGNPDQLRQVFWNLVLNAAEAEPPDRKVRVSAETLPPQEPEGELRAVIEILDRGTGIPPEILERVFEPFYTTKPKGTGLGLATVHRVVEAHGGQLLVRSRPGEGTSVRVVLPAATT